jgi:hypothetical protein
MAWGLLQDDVNIYESTAQWQDGSQTMIEKNLERSNRSIDEVPSSIYLEGMRKTMKISSLLDSRIIYRNSNRGQPKCESRPLPLQSPVRKLHQKYLISVTALEDCYIHQGIRIKGWCYLEEMFPVKDVYKTKLRRKCLISLYSTSYRA